MGDLRVPDHAIDKRLGRGVSGTWAESWGCGMTSAASSDMEGEVASSSDCIIMGLGRVEKSQGRGTYRFQIVSKTIYR